MQTAALAITVDMRGAKEPFRRNFIGLSRVFRGQEGPRREFFRGQSPGRRNSVRRLQCLGYDPSRGCPMKSSRQAASPDTLGTYLREIRKIALLTPEEEVALARRAKQGEEEALNELVRHNLRFVVSVAKQYAKSNV